MKKILFISIIFLVICSVCIKAQDNQIKLNQVELSKKLVGTWYEQNSKDTVAGFEMSSFKNATLETIYRSVNGIKELLGSICFNYDPKLEKFKGIWVHPDGQLDLYYFRFSSDKEIVFEQVEDFKSNKLMARNKFVFIAENQISGTYYNGNEVEVGSSKWARTSSGH